MSSSPYIKHKSEEEFIDMWRARRLLYASDEVEYMDRAKKYDATLEIAQHFGTTTAIVSQKMATLRTQYSKFIKIPRTGAGAKILTPRQLWVVQSLSFLGRYVTKRASTETEWTDSQSVDGEETIEDIKPEDTQQTEQDEQRSPDRVTRSRKAALAACKQVPTVCTKSKASKQKVDGPVTSTSKAETVIQVNGKGGSCSNDLDINISNAEVTDAVVTKGPNDELNGDLDNVDECSQESSDIDVQVLKDKGHGKNSKPEPAGMSARYKRRLDAQGGTKSKAKKAEAVSIQETEIYSEMQQTLKCLAQPDQVETANQSFCRALCHDLDMITERRAIITLKQVIRNAVFSAQIDSCPPVVSIPSASNTSTINPMHTSQLNLTLPNAPKNVQSTQYSQQGTWPDYRGQFPAGDGRAPNDVSFLSMMM